MTPVLVIAVILVVLLRDSLSIFPLMRDMPPTTVVALSVGVPVVLSVMSWIAVSAFGVRLRKSGRLLWVRLADLIVFGWGWGAVAAHAASVLAFGWLDLVREWLGGDVVLLDEALAIAPALITIVLSWTAHYSIDRIAQGGSVASGGAAGDGRARMPSRWDFVGDRARYSMLPVLLPIALLTAWSESVVIAIGWYEQKFAPGWDASVRDALAVGGQFVGVAVLLVLAPLSLRWLWRTSPLGESGLRERLVAMCRIQRVRCGAPLVWNTRGQMLNGAVIGLVPPFRYVLLTDALIELLSPRHIEAVMAHELAHAKYRHLPWLIGSLLGSILLTWIGASWIIERWIVNPEWMESQQLAPDIVAAIALPLGLIAGVLVFGFVSRRFERQADAFAVKHMAGDISLDGEGILISEDAAGAMSESLRQVARYNHISLDRFTWRHGSIAQRIAAIHGLTGRSTRTLPIDRQIRIIKIVSLLAIVGLIVLAVRDHSILE